MIVFRLKLLTKYLNIIQTEVCRHLESNLNVIKYLRRIKKSKNTLQFRSKKSNKSYCSYKMSRRIMIKLSTSYSSYLFMCLQGKGPLIYNNNNNNALAFPSIQSFSMFLLFCYWSGVSSSNIAANRLNYFMMNNDKESCFYSKMRSKHQLTAHNIKTRSEMQKRKKK